MRVLLTYMEIPLLEWTVVDQNLLYKEGHALKVLSIEDHDGKRHRLGRKFGQLYPQTLHQEMAM